MNVAGIGGMGSTAQEGAWPEGRTTTQAINLRARTTTLPKRLIPTFPCLSLSSYSRSLTPHNLLYIYTTGHTHTLEFTMLYTAGSDVTNSQPGLSSGFSVKGEISPDSI